MASNTTTYTYQHTCKRGQKAYILANAPFRSVKKRTAGGKTFIPFLGEGFYLWEENKEAAEYWGKRNYNGQHSIVEYTDTQINNDDLLDFCNRRDIQFFKELQNIYIEKSPTSKNWNLGTWIEFFKKLHVENKVNFPFYFFRAQEEISEAERKKHQIGALKINLSSPGYSVDLDPYIMICATDKNKLIYSNRSIL